MPALDVSSNPAVAAQQAPHLAYLQARFAPVFARIAEGAAQREHQRELAYEPIEWLREAGYTALRVPVQSGGSGAKLQDLFALWVDLSVTDYVVQVVVQDIATVLAGIAQQRARGEPVSKEQLDALEVRTAQAQVVIVEPVLQAATKLFDVGGASALGEPLRLDRHWRNARTLASHNPVIYKAQAVGNTLLNGAEPVYYWSVGVKAA